MIAARTIAVSYALIGWLIAPPLSAQTTQTAKANGPCSAAINAGAGAKVFSKIDCAAIDAKTKAAIKKLEAKGAQNTKVDRDQAQAITALKGSDARQDETIKKLSETIAGFLINAQSPGASGEDVAIASAIERGDATVAARLIRAKAGRNIKQAAQLYLQEAELLATKDVRLAIRAATDSANADPTNFWTWILLSRLHRAAGSLPQARRTAEAALQHVGGDYDRMVAEGELGDIAVVQGESSVARRHYQGAMQAAKSLADATPDNRNLQRQLSVAHIMLGDVAIDEGDLAGARAGYGAGLAIRERLAASDPGNTEWQFDLGISFERLGNVALAQGDLDSAKTNHQKRHDIIERLAAFGPGNARWQRDLSLSHEKLGDVAVAQGDLAGARTAYAAGLAIRERLAVSDPGNAEWQFDLSLIHARLGDLAKAKGDLAGARTAYGAAQAIRERLAASDPGNAEWQRELFVSHDRMARIAKASGDAAGAIREFEAGEAILVALIARVGDHPGFVRDLADVRGDIARLRAK